MFSFAKKDIKKLTSIYFYILVIVNIAVITLPWWPTATIFSYFKYILLYAPRWLLFFALAVLFLLWNYLSKIQKYLIPLLFLSSFNYIDFGLNIKNNSDKIKNREIKIITANIGQGGEESRIKLLLKYYQPDILLLQEAKNIPKNLSETYRYSECLGGLCIISKHSFERTNELSRKLISGLGYFATFYEVYIGKTPIRIANVHLQSVHALLINIAKNTADLSEIETLEDNKRIESGLISSWISNNPNAIIAGDFNMPIEDNVYHDNFSSINNALSEGGIGFNDTLKTYGLSLRIDHILYNQHFGIVDAQVIESLGGDHIPVMTTLTIN